MSKSGWVELDMEAYAKIVAESKDDKEFRRKLKELEKQALASQPQKGEKP